jgi:Omp85 superfamily domain
MSPADSHRGKHHLNGLFPQPGVPHGLFHPGYLLLVFLMLYASLGSFDMSVVAQDGPPAAKAAEHTAPSITTDSSASADESTQTKEPGQPQEIPNKNKKESQGAIVIAPIPISSPAIGSGVIIVGGYIFPFRKADKVSPPSTVGGAALITNNGSRGLALGGDFYLKENTYHITTTYFRGNINYDFYGVGTNLAQEGRKLPLKQTGEAFFGEFLYRLKWKFFLGPRLLTGNSTITLRPTIDTGLPPPPEIGIQTTLTGLGFRLNRDTRPNRFYPTEGTVLDFTSTFFSEALGSKYSFQSFRFTFNYYQSLSQKQVLAYNLYTCATAGDPPFYGECLYGTNNQLRGYVAAQYIDRYMIATQLEYRLALPWRFGIVAFGGIGEVAPSVGQFRYRNILPGGGGGLRFKLSAKYNVNLRADIAQGLDGHTFSMGIGEAF